jgi:AcrR family transcriptional regulator
MQKSPTPPPTSTPPDQRRRADGAQSRERLLMTAMRLFAEQGFARTSTREIALAAGTNIASISYYFGDKAGLYRAAFTEPPPHPRKDVEAFSRPGATLRESLEAFYTMLLAPLKQGDMARLCMRLWFREMLEPTGLWHEEIDNGIRPAHAALVQIISHHLGLKAPDDEICRLAFAMVGMAMQLMVGRDVIDKISPHLMADDAAIDAWHARLVEYALALADAEAARRRTDKKTPTRKKKA